MKDKLSKLNELRSKAGMNPLKSWKASGAKLDEAIQKLAPPPEPEKPPINILPKGLARGTDTESHCRKAVADDRRKHKRSVKVPSKPIVEQSAAVKKVAAKMKTVEGTFSLADLARELNINPKVARAKARRHSDKVDVLRGSGLAQWVFPATARSALTELLK